MVYGYSRQDDKHLEIITETIQKFPDYLFGKIALAEYYLRNNKHREVPKVLNGKFEIYRHYPSNVKVFHFSEVRAFYSVVGTYYARSNKMARALFCYLILDEVDPGHLATQRLGDEIIRREIEKLRKSMS